MTVMNRNTAIKRKENTVLHKVMTASSITYFYHLKIPITERVANGDQTIKGLLNF